PVVQCRGPSCPPACLCVSPPPPPHTAARQDPLAHRLTLPVPGDCQWHPAPSPRLAARRHRDHSASVGRAVRRLPPRSFFPTPRRHAAVESTRHAGEPPAETSLPRGPREPRRRWYQPSPPTPDP